MNIIIPSENVMTDIVVKIPWLYASNVGHIVTGTRHKLTVTVAGLGGISGTPKLCLEHRSNGATTSITASNVSGNKFTFDIEMDSFGINEEADGTYISNIEHSAENSSGVRSTGLFTIIFERKDVISL